MSRPPKTKRNERIRQLIEAGCSFRQVAKRYRIKAPTVHGIFTRSGGKLTKREAEKRILAGVPPVVHTPPFTH